MLSIIPTIHYISATITHSTSVYEEYDRRDYHPFLAGTHICKCHRGSNFVVLLCQLCRGSRTMVNLVCSNCGDYGSRQLAVFPNQAIEVSVLL